MINPNELITINPQELILAKDEAGNILLTPEAKNELEKILYMKKLIEDVYEYAQTRLTEEMQKQNIQKVVAGNVTVLKRFFGERYVVAEDAPDEFKKEVKWIKANAESIDEYVEKNGELPSGVSLKDRVEKVSITQRGGEE